MTRSADSSAPAHDLIDSLLAQPSPEPHTWRRLFAVDHGPNLRPKTIPLRDTPTSSASVGNNLTTRAVASIAPINRSQPAGSLGSPYVQPRVITVAESCAKKGLETLVEPFTYEQASRLPGWSPTRAKHWIRKLKAKGELRATPRGHFKTEGWTR